MELKFAFLALHADHSQSRDIWVVAADFDRLEVSALPIQAKFCIVFKMRVEPHEAEQPHVFRLDVSKPNGERSAISGDRRITTNPNPVDAARPSGASIIVNTAVVFGDPGEYLFHIIVDDREVAALPLLVQVHAAEAD